MDLASLFPSTHVLVLARIFCISIFFIFCFQKYELEQRNHIGYCLGSNESLIGEIRKLYNISADISVIKPSDWDGYVNEYERGQRSTCVLVN